MRLAQQRSGGVESHHGALYAATVVFLLHADASATYGAVVRATAESAVAATNVLTAASPRCSPNSSLERDVSRLRYGSSRWKMRDCNRAGSPWW
jgi:hypothetical protein